MPPVLDGVGAAVASANNVATPTTLTPVLPAHSVGELLLAATFCRSGTPTVATPAGWTQLVNVVGTNGRIVLFGKIAASGSETNPAIVWSGLTTGTTGTPVQAQCAVWSGMLETITGITDILGTVENGAASTSVAASGTAISTVTANDLVLSLSCRLDDAGTWTPPAGFMAVGSALTTSGADMSFAWAYQVKATPGSVAPADFGLAGASSFASTGVLIALKQRVPVTYFGAISRPITFGATTAGNIVVPITFPDVDVVDDFNRADQYPPGSSWVGSINANGWRIITNQLVLPGGNSDFARWNVPPTLDQELFLKLVQGGTLGSYLDLFVRADTGTPIPQNGYYVELGDQDGGIFQFQFFRRTGGNSTPLGPTTQRAIAVGDSVGVSISGSTLSFFHKPAAGPWALVASIEDSVITSPGQVSVYGTTVAAAWILDDFGGPPTAVGTTHYGVIDRPFIFGKSVAGDISIPLVYADLVKSKAISYWRLGETSGTVAADEMGLHDGAYTALPTLGVAGLLTGDPDGAMQVAGGTGQGFDVGNPSDYQLDTVTLEAWIKAANPGNSYRTLFTKSSAFGVYLLDGIPTTYEWAGGGAGPHSSNINVADGLRHHIAVVFRLGVASGSQIYIDGVAAGAPFLHSSTDQTKPLQAGFNDFPGQELVGVLDELAIYDEALTPAEIAEHYQAGITGAPPSEPTTHYGSTSLALTAGISTAGRRQTFSTVAIPMSFTASTDGRRKTLGQIALPVTFSKEISGQRKTFGQLLSPFIFGKAVSARKTTFGQTAFSINVSIATSGLRPGLTQYGALAFPVTFSKDVRGQRKAFGQVTLPLIFAKDIKGVRKTFGQISMPIVFTKEAVGRKNIFGQLSMQTLFGKEITGNRKTFSQVVMPITFSKAVAGRKQTFGKVALPIDVVIVVNGQAFVGPKTLYGSLAMPLAFSKQVIAYRKTFGQVTAPFIFGSASQGQRRTFSQSSLPINFIIDVETGRVGTHSQISLPIIVDFDIDGKAFKPGVILNLADAVYLGSELAEAIYVGIERVWPIFNPTKIAGLKIWLDANQLSLVDGGMINTWPSLADLTLVGTNFNTAPYRPTLRAAALNGLPVVRFIAGSGMRWSGFGLEGEAGLNWTCVFVSRMWGTTPGRVVTAGYPPTNILIGYHSGNEDKAFVEGWLYPDVGHAQTTNWHLYTATQEGVVGSTKAWFYSNGIFLSGDHPVTGGWNGSSFHLNGYSFTSGEETCDCEIAEVLLYNRKLPDVDRQMVESYLREKWGL